MRKAYRLKHKPTGLYWAKKIHKRPSDDRIIRRHLDVLSKVGVLEAHPERKWDPKTCGFYNTGKSLYT